MRSTIALASLLLCGLASCCHPPLEPMPSAKRTIIAYGNYHGMCIGYCWSQMTVDTTSVELLLRPYGRGNGSGLPDSLRRGTITRAEWDDLLASTDFAAIQTLDTLYGCPDCADQGAEFLQITKDGVTKKITRDPGLSVPKIDALMAKLRTIYDRMSR